MVGRKTYELLDLKVIQWNDEDVLTASINGKDKLFITDETNWSEVE